jgi:cytoskeletal protein RodZ
MIDKKTIVSFLSALTHGRKKNFVKQTIRPRREWFIGLVLFVLIVSLGGIFSISNFTRFADIHLTLKAVPQAVESYKENTVKKALEIYRSKEREFTALDGEVVKQVEEIVEEEVTSSDVPSEPSVTEVNASTTEEIAEPVGETTVTEPDIYTEAIQAF